jgi:hypothetical protein
VITFLKILEYIGEIRRKDISRICRKSYNYFLCDGFLWNHPKLMDDLLQWVMHGFETQQKIIKELHMSW